MLRFDRKFGQLDAASDTATVTGALDGSAGQPASSFLPYYLVAVAAGVTVWLVTKFLGRKT